MVHFARTVGCDGLRDLKFKLAGALAVDAPLLVPQRVAGRPHFRSYSRHRRQHHLGPGRLAASTSPCGYGAGSRNHAPRLACRLLRDWSDFKFPRHGHAGSPVPARNTTNAFSDAYLQLVATAAQTNTPLAAIADIVLRIDVPHDATMRMGTDAYVVQLLMVEILMVIIGLKRGPSTINRLRDIHDILLTRGVDSDDPSLLHWGWNEILRSEKGEAG